MRRAVTAGAALLLVVAALAGCAAEPPFKAAVTQPRTDIALGRIAVQVHNVSDVDLNVLSVQLDSPLLAEPLYWSGTGPVTITPNRAVDLRVALGEWNCAPDAAGEATATVGFELGDAPAQVSSALARDITFVLQGLHDSACLAARVAEVAVVESVGLEHDGVAGHPGELVLSVSPTGADGVAVIDTVGSTTLLAPFDGERGVNQYPLGVELSAGGPTEVRVPMVPNRCDVHALAEDKIGTRIPLMVSVAGESGRIVLPASDEVRGQMHRFYSDYCALGQ